MLKVLVTAPEYDKARCVFEASTSHGLMCIRAPAAEVDLASVVREHGARHVIVGVERYAGSLYEALPRGGVIARFGVGHDGIDKSLATSCGLFCTNTPGVLDDSVAELTIALILTAWRRLPKMVAGARQGDWTVEIGGELRGRTLAVIGCGAIGCRVARIASAGFGMNVVGCDVGAVDESRLRKDCGFAELSSDYPAAVRDADVVSLHIPANDATRHFMNAERLACLRPEAWLVNTSRGSVLDEAALYDAISAGRLAGAALDVFEHEPYRPVTPDKDLRMLRSVIMTPHIGSSTCQACDRMAMRALENVRLAEEGRYHGMDLINPEVLEQHE